MRLAGGIERDTGRRALSISKPQRYVRTKRRAPIARVSDSAAADLHLHGKFMTECHVAA
jgi:hypothetical protein